MRRFWKETAMSDQQFILAVVGLGAFMLGYLWGSFR